MEWVKGEDFLNVYVVDTAVVTFKCNLNHGRNLAWINDIVYKKNGWYSRYRDKRRVFIHESIAYITRQVIWLIDDWCNTTAELEKNKSNTSGKQI